LRDRYFDAAIIFTSFSQSPHPAGFVCYLAGIPLRLGESKEWGGAVLTQEVASAPDEIHQVERNLRLIEVVGFEVRDRSLSIQISAVAQQEATRLLAQHGISAGAPYILLNPWTSCQSRNYDSGRFAAAARQLAETTNWPIVVTGVAKDRERSGSLLKALSPHAIDAIGSTTLPQLAALIANARLVLTNNTSTMHLADATRTPTVVMFAGTEYESQWQPRNGPSRLLRRPTPCSPCYAFTCPYQLECLDIPPEEVVAAGLELLSL
jgi:ADP-heptose:LPS heptosyltransferase